MSARLPIKIDATSNGEFRPVPLGPVLRAARRLATHRITANPFCEIEVGVPFPLACLPIERVPSAGCADIFCVSRPAVDAVSIGSKSIASSLLALQSMSR